MSRIVGIDPGKAGALALIDGEKAWVETMPLAGNEIDPAELAVILKGWEPTVAYVERVHSMPKQGVASSFTFGMGFGILRGVLGALGIRAEFIPPPTWKAQVLAGTTRDKNAAIEYCRRAYPSVRLVQPGCRKAHDGVADAVCLAAYGKWREGR